jgi:molybdenum cofactor synthesis domain-containing protein
MSDFIRAGVLTISDRCSRGEMADTAGPAVVAALRDDLRAHAEHAAIVPDEADRIERTLRQWLGGGQQEPEGPEKTRGRPELICTVGGTGFGPRDITPEVVSRVIDRPAPGLMELSRARCFARTPLAALSRGVAGAAGSTLIITLPGSQHGAVETLQALTDIIPHALEMLRGGSHPGDFCNPPSVPATEDKR